ncbi:signal transduction histidine kinase [Luteibacter sp. 1214]|uniref:sensor histidine kinase n=1 Tax=Luteibacter sp. 1214 TaxID=2817735 RepID=UPI00285F2BE0|nr:HAMP domain-containing sensor histidine kinase [Luteibacter sp. 1214]MDR6641087.1 signal transduction histidine kinase [Luteibacter sp. 1214]
MHHPGKSLTKRLAWRLSVLQTLTLVATIAALTWSLINARASYIDDAVSKTILRSLVVQGGALRLDDDRDMAMLLTKSPGLWFAAADEQGRYLEYGHVPGAYAPFVAALPSLEASEIHSGEPPYVMTMRLAVDERDGDRIHVMVGGVPISGPAVLVARIAFYLGWRIGLPLVLLTLIAVPWIIHRAMAGVGRVARQAEDIDIADRGARLEDGAVPRELQPLVRAFNTALARLAEGYDARDRFLTDAAHELRAPIAILEARLAALPPGDSRTRLLTDLARLANIAEQLLDLQRLGRQPDTLGVLDLVALAREVSSDVAPLVLDAGYELAMDAPDHPVKIVGDRLSLSRALTNLIQNAIVHAGGRGLIHVEVHDDGVLQVSDQGPGIPREERARVFTPFYRLQPSSVGTGLGLHLVQEIVARHGGDIGVTDAPGGGARFRIRLPSA